MRLSRTFRISGILTVLGFSLLILLGRTTAGRGVLKPMALTLLLVAVPTFIVSALRHLIRGLLWRVGTRLLVSYLLIGVVPIPIVAGFLFAGTLVLCGQLAGRRAEGALRSRTRMLQTAAESLAGASRLVSGGEARKALFEHLRAEKQDSLPGLEYASVSPAEEAASSGGLPPSKLETPGEGGSSFLLARWNGHVYLVGGAAAGKGRLLLALPIGEELAKQLRQETGIRVGFATTVTRPKRTGTKGPPAPKRETAGLVIDTKDENVRLRTLSSSGPKEAAVSAPHLVDREWVHWFLPLGQVFDWESGEALSDGRLVLSVHSSVGREMRELFGSVRIGTTSGTETGTIVLKIMKGLALGATGVYFLASLLAGFLVLRIARASHRLSRGFAEIDRGNFSHRARLRGRDQLAGLVESFNQMASHLEASVTEKASHEALARELETARDLQRRLLPSPDFTFPGLQISVDFCPTSAIGGDFYHFLADGPDRLTVVVADVSGHGLSTGIVMAAAKASLSAFATTGAHAVAVLSSLDEAIRRTTDARTFVTLAHLRFLFDRGEIEFTNAGHVYPYRVEPLGTVTALANPARPLGLRLPVSFRTVRAPLVPGDLWVLRSDGSVGALSADGEVFGFARPERLLARGAGGTAEELRDRVLAAWRAFTGNDTPADDRTLLVLKIVRREEP